MTQPRLFLSHAHADRGIASALSSLLIQLGVSPDDLFYTSRPDTGAAAGEDFRQRLRREAREASLMIQLISESYFASTACVMELGAQWVLETPSFPVLVPPIRFVDINARVGPIQATSIQDEAKFTLLYGVIAEIWGLTESTARWKSSWEEFSTRVEKVLQEQVTSESGPSALDADSSDVELAKRDQRIVELELQLAAILGS